MPFVAQVLGDGGASQSLVSSFSVIQLNYFLLFSVVYFLNNQLYDSVYLFHSALLVSLVDQYHHHFSCGVGIDNTSIRSESVFDC